MKFYFLTYIIVLSQMLFAEQLNYIEVHQVSWYNGDFCKEKPHYSEEKITKCEKSVIHGNLYDFIDNSKDCKKIQKTIYLLSKNIEKQVSDDIRAVIYFNFKDKIVVYFIDVYGTMFLKNEQYGFTLNDELSKLLHIRNSVKKYYNNVENCPIEIYQVPLDTNFYTSNQIFRLKPSAKQGCFYDVIIDLKICRKINHYLKKLEKKANHQVSEDIRVIVKLYSPFTYYLIDVNGVMFLRGEKYGFIPSKRLLKMIKIRNLK